jgi:uncharacterized Zn-binding protein involved in type VI secretion
MPKTARKGKDIAGSTILTGRLTVIVNDTPIATLADVITPHIPGGPHSGAVIVGYEPTVIAEDRPVARQGDAVSCGHVIQTGSDNVITGQ